MGERRQHRVAERAQRAGVADVGGRPQRPPSPPFDEIGGFVDRRLPAAGGDDVGAGVGQAERDGAANPGRAADDDGGPASQIE